MCDACARPAAAGAWSRRRFLAVGAGSAVAAVAGPVVVAWPVTVAGASGARRTLEVLPRSAWAGDARPAGPVAEEPDVRFLLVHHTVDANDYPANDVVRRLVAIHRFHTGPDKGWPDIAYHFVVDRFGRVWETRAGSLASLTGGPAVAGDATGGNQGADQKCAFLGDHRTEAPTAAAQGAMVDLLAALADRHGIATAPGSTTSFTSRGSNRWPAGSTVDTATITGHRTMSSTACPGDAAMALVTDDFPSRVTARRGAAPPPSSSVPTAPVTAAPGTTAPGTTVEPTTTTTGPTTTTTEPAPASTTTAPVPEYEDTVVAAPDASPSAPPGSGDDVRWPAAVAVGAIGLAALLGLRTRRLR